MKYKAKLRSSLWVSLFLFNYTVRSVGLKMLADMEEILEQFRLVLPTAVTQNLYLRHVVFGLVTNYNHITCNTALLCTIRFPVHCIV